MYKALFELSTDRADFVSRLFSKKRPAGLTAASTAQDIFAAYEKVETDDENLYKANLAAIDDHLVKTRGLQLTEEDLKGIEYVYYQFFNYGPSIQVLVDGRQRARRANGSDVRRSHDGRGRHGTRPELPGQRGELRTAQGARGEEPARPGCRQLRRQEGASRRRARTSAITARSFRRSTSRTSNSIWGATGSGESSARTSRRCRWTNRARSFARCEAATSSPASVSTPSWATWSAKRSRAG